MSHSDFLDDIQEINLAYLLLAQRLLGEDREAGMLRLKIDPAMADLVTSLNARQLTRLARSNQLMCQLTMESAEQLRQTTDNPRDQGLGGIHASLLLAQRSVRSLLDAPFDASHVTDDKGAL